MTSNDRSFKGKVYYYANINGQEQRIEKEFDSAQDMDQFVQTQKIPSFSAFMPSFSFSPSWGLPMDTRFDDLFERKLATRALPEQSALAELRAEKIRLEREEAEKAKKRSFFQKLIDEAKELKSFFESRDDSERAAKAQAQIEAYEKELV